MPRTAFMRGLLFGAGGVYLAAVGVLLMLHNRWIIVGTVSLGQAILVLLGIGAGAVAAGAPRARLLAGAVAGLAAAVPVAALAALIALVPLRSIFIALSPALLVMLTAGLGLGRGVALLLGAGLLSGWFGATVRLSPSAFRRALIADEIAEFTCLVGTLAQEVYQTHPAIRDACQASIVGHAATLEADIAAAMRLYAVSADFTPCGLALHTQAVLQGAFILAKATGEPAVAIESVDHLRRYVELLFRKKKAA